MFEFFSPQVTKDGDLDCKVLPKVHKSFNVYYYIMTDDSLI